MSKQTQRAIPTRRIRNYTAMSDEKLLRVERELENRGEAYHRARTKGSGDPARDLSVVRALIESRGL